MLDAIANYFSNIITFIYNIVPNLGVAIIILTLLIKLITFPLNNKQIQSTKKMQHLQPEIKKIQEKYKNDKEKQNQAMSDFMQENNYSPLSGCLPLIIQLPILIGMFRMLREAELFLDIDKINPYLFRQAELIDLLAIPNITFENFLSNISLLYVFPLIAGATTYFYSKISTPATGSAGESSQKMMLYMMPVMITVFSFSFPAGLVLYWVANNLLSIGQHKVIEKMGDDQIEGQESEKTKTNHKQVTGEKTEKPDSEAGSKGKESKRTQRKNEKSKSEVDFLKVGTERKASKEEKVTKNKKQG